MRSLLRLETLAVLGRPDVLRDLHVYGGLVLAAVGGWHLSPPITSITVGLTLAAMGLFAGRSLRRPSPERT